MTPLMEEKDEEHEDVYVRTLVVEVPPLGQPTERRRRSRGFPFSRCISTSK
jgi:hypothetical protein